MNTSLDYSSLVEENNNLKKEIENLTIMMNELELTNNNLISATWRERELKKILANTFSELEKSKEVIENQNKKISESINYSKRIQDSILPNEESLKGFLENSFILYIPKDVVSGDFPFFFQVQEDLGFVAAVDCTGHGVPGAMLSLIGHLILNDILSKANGKPTSEILLQLHKMIVKTLRQDVKGNYSPDGMDIALCKITKSSQKLKFSGAHRPLYHIRGKEFIEYPGSRKAIGGTRHKKESTFEDYEVDIMKDDLFVICSDGFQDQFGGPENEKYGSPRLQEFIRENSTLPMNELKAKLKEEYMTWKGNHKQIDDVILIGFKLL